MVDKPLLPEQRVTQWFFQKIYIIYFSIKYMFHKKSWVLVLQRQRYHSMDMFHIKIQYSRRPKILAFLFFLSDTIVIWPKVHYENSYLMDLMMLTWYPKYYFPIYKLDQA